MIQPFIRSTMGNNGSIGRKFRRRGRPDSDRIEVGVRLPVKIPESWTFQDFSDAFGDTTDVWVFGLLVSPSDLFASPQHRIDSIAINGGMASLGIQTMSPRPATGVQGNDGSQEKACIPVSPVLIAVIVFVGAALSAMFLSVIIETHGAPASWAW